MQKEQVGDCFLGDLVVCLLLEAIRYYHVGVRVVHVLASHLSDQMDGVEGLPGFWSEA